MTGIDALMFDMDGTLWDAVDTYAMVWDDVMAAYGIHRAPTTRAELIDCMGLPMDEIVRRVVPAPVPMDEFLEAIDSSETRLVRLHGGRLYPGVEATLAELARRMPLFLVSNCGRYGLENFMDVTGLRRYFTDTRTFGEAHLPKEENILDLCRRYGLQQPLYVGDTAGDERAARAARVPFAFASYGFGTATSPDLTLHTFPDLLTLIPTAQ